MRSNLCLGRAIAPALGVLAFVGGTASASLTFAGSSSGWGTPGLKSAEVTFAVFGNDLQVTLTNTSANDVLVPADVLTAVFFDVSGAGLSLSRTSGLLNAGSTVFYDSDGQPAGGVIGGEWAYKSGLSGAPSGASYGISSTGLDLFGPGDRFPGPDLQSPPSPDGLQYGLLSAGDNTATGNGGITGSGGLIKNSVVFRLGNLPSNFDLNRINNVFFLYGTTIGEGGFNVPAPGAAAVLLAGGLVIGRRRR